MIINYSSKKGQGMPMNVIIIAILALIVLFVMVMIFVKNIDKNKDNLNACFTGEECVSSKANCEDGFAREVDGCRSSTGSSGNFCCRTFGGGEE